jgi:hypothetical protein
MKINKRKCLQIRIPSKYKEIFVKYKDKIPELIDLVYSKNIPIQRIEDFDIYDERMTITIDKLYYEKLLELSQKYKMKISTLIRNILLNLILQ